MSFCWKLVNLEIILNDLGTFEGYSLEIHDALPNSLNTSKFLKFMRRKKVWHLQIHSHSFQDYDLGEHTVLHAVRRRETGSRSNSGTSSPAATHSNSGSTSPTLHRQILTRGLNDISELQTEQEKSASNGKTYCFNVIGIWIIKKHWINLPGFHTFVWEWQWYVHHFFPTEIW